MPKNNKKFALKVNKISKSFEENLVLDEVSFSMYFGEKIGLIGQNGEGKTTVAKIIIGNLKVDRGDVFCDGESGVAYLPQEFNEIQKIYDFLDFESLSISNQKEIKSVALKMNLPKDFLQRSFGELSGGQASKIALIKIIFNKSNIVVLDEPTNNLDLDGIKELEKIVSSSKKAFLIISHDRKFLDNTVSKIIKLEGGKIKTYYGNYSQYLEQKENEENLLAQRYQSHIKKEKLMKNAYNLKLQYKDNVEKRIRDKRSLSSKITDKDHLGKTVLKGVAGVAGREARIFKEKLEILQDERPDNVKWDRPLKIDFSGMKRSGDVVLKIKNLTLKNGDFVKKIGDIDIYRGERILVSGENGTGKTTLIKSILESYETNNENIIWGANVVFGFLPQKFGFTKIEEEGSFEDLFMQKSQKDRTDSGKILSRFGFDREDLIKSIKDFSPGMRSRGQIAIMMSNNPNLLLLDEPTNNLDMEVLGKFEESLKGYKGTIVYVSHDRFFVDRIGFDREIKL